MPEDERRWHNVIHDPPPENVVVEVENNGGALLKKSGNLWWFPDGSGYAMGLYDWANNNYSSLLAAWHDGNKIKAIKALRSMHYSPEEGTQISLINAKEAFEVAGKHYSDYSDEELYCLSRAATNLGYRMYEIFPSKARLIL